MKLLLIAVGRTEEKELEILIDKYIKRINFYMPFKFETTPNIKKAKISEENQKNIEADTLIKLLNPTDYVVLLDEKGDEYNSIDFSKFIQSKALSVSKRLVFIIGGPYGFSDKIYNLAKEKISLSKMTLTHQMIRLLFTEQVYRAMTILNNEPYHHQ
ncbi:MAG: 23S rRNA (pseudouridine(1915)-N(3))-methyltransferase RlmH [Fermentimonas sp.]|jgi:23S rRNA (pseudouridine1915-N3)-methyltransferase